jgi:hypothetical protein
MEVEQDEKQREFRSRFVLAKVSIADIAVEILEGDVLFAEYVRLLI